MSQENKFVVWNEVLSILKEQIPEATFNSWILLLEPQYYDESHFVLGTGQMLAPALLRPHMAQITEALNQVLGTKLAIDIKFFPELKEKLDKKTAKRAIQIAKEEAESQKERPITEKYKYDSLTQMQSSNLNLKYKFENFVIGSNNNFAFKAAETVAKNPGKKYNPLYIYGGPGLGKTHLMQAIGHYIITNTNTHPSKIVYITSEEFMNDVVNSLAKGDNTNKKMSSFRKKYREAEVLLIDDIQFIAGKERTQLEVFNTFNALHGAGKQIVLSSDRPPNEIPTLQERLSSRFASGLMADIQVPDIETRMAILINLAKDSNIEVPNNIIEFVATIYSSNIRELEGAFNLITAHASINNVPLTLENVKNILKYKEKEKNYTFSSIVNAVAEYYNLPTKEIMGTSRAGRIPEARQVAIYLCRDLTKQSFPDIGAFFKKTHTTMMYSHKIVKDSININKALAHTITDICTQLDS